LKNVAKVKNVEKMWQDHQKCGKIIKNVANAPEMG
jgi:hypothetical protein